MGVMQRWMRWTPRRCERVRVRGRVRVDLVLPTGFRACIRVRVRVRVSAWVWVRGGGKTLVGCYAEMDEVDTTRM